MPFPLTPEVHVGSKGAAEESLTTVLYQREGGHFKKIGIYEKQHVKKKN